MPINRLETSGINASDIKKLQEAGLHTVESVRGRSSPCARCQVPVRPTFEGFTAFPPLSFPHHVVNIAIILIFCGANALGPAPAVRGCCQKHAGIAFV